MAQPAAKVLIGFVVAAVVLLVAAVIFTFSQPAPSSAPLSAPLPQPNGYDDFVKAGGMVTDNAFEYGTMSEEELRGFVRTNAEALKLARSGLERECRVPLHYSVTNAYWNHLPAHKRLAFTLAAEGRLAEMENRPADAEEAYLAVIRLGCAISQGGLMIDSLVSIALDTIGTARMEKLAPTLDAKRCREAASAIESCEARRESTQVIRARERAWARRTWGFQGQIAHLLAFKAVKQSEQKWEAKVKTQQARTGVLLIQLAARAYELEKGERPKGLADLVPGYLKSIPQDPLTGTNMTYP